MAGFIDVAAVVGDAPLDLHEGISTPTGSEGPAERLQQRVSGCSRWPESLRLRSSRGEFVPGRCRATNLCAYCAKLAAVENAEVLWIDAMSGNAPTLWLVLTTRSTNTTPSAYYEARRKVLRALKRRWPRAEIVMLFEMTTGHGPRSGGHRRPHWNLWVKGVAGHEQAAAEVAMRVWCDRPDVDAVPDAQTWRRVHDMRGLTRYCALHFQKQDQAPPKGWRGQRFRASNGYFHRPMTEVRAEAKESLKAGRRLWKARQALGEDASAELLELEAAAIAERENGTSWELVHVRRTPGGVIVPGPAVTRPTPAEATIRLRHGRLVDTSTGEILRGSGERANRHVDGAAPGPWDFARGSL